MLYLLYSWFFILLMVFIGLGLSLLLTPRELRKYVLLLSPIVGYCYLTLAGWYLYTADFPGTDETAIYLMIFPVLFFLLAYLRQKFFPEYKTTNLISAKESALPIAIGCLGFMFSSTPFLISPDVLEMDSLTSISMGSNDIADSATLATCLKLFAKSDTIGFLGQTGKLRWLVENSIFGGSYSVAFASSILSLETYQLQSMSLHIFFFFAVCLFFVLAKEGFAFNVGLASIVTGLFAFNSVMYYGIYQGFQGQIYTLPISLLLYFLFISVLQTDKSFKDYLRYTPLTVLGLWGISITYPHILPILLAPIIIFGVLFGFVKKCYQKIGLFFGYLTISGIISALLSPDRAHSIINYTLLMGRVEAGWFMPLLSLEKWFGMNLNNPDFNQPPGLFNLIISAVLLSFSGVGVWRTFKRDSGVALLALVFLSFIICGYLVLGFLGQVNGQFGGYKSFKFVSYLLPMMLLASFLWIRKVSFKRLTDGLANFFFVVVIIGLIGMTTLSTAQVVSRVVDNHLVVDHGLAALNEIKRDKRIHSVNVLSKNWWDNLWMVNFLIEKKLYLETSTYLGRNRSKLKGQWDIFRCSGIERDLLYVPNGTVYADEGIVLKKVDTGGFDIEAFNATLSPVVNNIQLEVNEQRAVKVRIKNCSRITWVNDCRYGDKYALNLSYHVRDIDGRMIMFDGERSNLPKAVKPGEEIVVEAIINAPSTNGKYIIEFDLVLEDYAWFASKGSKTASLDLAVK